MSRHPALALSTIVLAAIFACDDPVSPNPIRLATDAQAYIAIPGAPIGTGREYSLIVIATLMNTGARPVILGRCSGSTRYPIYSVTSSTAGGAAYSPGWACVGGHDFRLAPGVTRADTLPLRGPWAVDHYTGVPQGAFDGRFQLLYEIQICRDATAECRDRVPDTILSNTFTIQRGS